MTKPSTSSSSALFLRNPLILNSFRWYTTHKSIILKFCYLLLLVFSFTQTSFSRKKQQPSSSLSTETTDVDANDAATKKKNKFKLDKKTIKDVFQAIVPTWRSKVPLYFAFQLSLLATRALLTLRVAALDGWLVSSLIKKDTTSFLKLLAQWMFLGIPASLTNSLLDFTTNQLSLNINKNLTADLMKTYLPSEEDPTSIKIATKKNPNYYSLNHMPNNKINDPNQRITTDVSNLSSSLASLPNHILKPSLDLMLCSFELAKFGSAEGTLILGLVAHTTSLLLKLFSPNFTKLAIERSRLEGILRVVHSRLNLFNEEIALLSGHKRELDIVDKSYYELEKFTNYEIRARAIYDIATDFIVKYTWGAAGLVLCATPIFINKFKNVVDENSSAHFITNRRLLLSASNSLGMLIQSRKEIQQVAGYIKRTSEFRKALLEIDSTTIVSKGLISYDNNTIEFKKIPLVTPAGITLAKELTFKINHGDNLLIIGPNGCGKSSLFRILGGLWPVDSGELILPDFENVFYLPQRAYLFKSSLKDQIIYPQTKYKYNNNKELHKILKVLKLEFLINENISLELARDPMLNVNEIDPFETVRNWPEELSIGVQQRLAMARLYYHKPKFAVLDECTSAVSPQMEQLMYSYAQSLSISILSVAHRSSLWHFHNYFLKFDGKGGYYFGKLDAEKRLAWENELIEVNKSLRDVPVLQARLEDLKIAQESQQIKRTKSHPKIMQRGIKAH